MQPAKVVATTSLLPDWRASRPVISSASWMTRDLDDPVGHRPLVGVEVLAPQLLAEQDRALDELVHEPGHLGVEKDENDSSSASMSPASASSASCASISSSSSSDGPKPRSSISRVIPRRRTPYPDMERRCS